MSEKPPIMQLARDAKEFVRDNRKMMWHYAMPTLAPVLTCQLGATIGIVFTKWLAILSFANLYFIGAFILAWHRASLMGIKPQHAVDPLRPKRGEGKFIGIVIGIALVPFLFGLVAGVPMGFAIVMHQKLLIVGLSVALLALLIYSVVFSLRLAFMLPARSVNVSLTIGETGPVSQGLRWRLFAAGTVAMIGPALLILLLRVIAELVDSLLRIPRDSLTGVLVIAAIAVLPGVLINYVVYARYVTVLSRLYQWSVQNRPLSSVKSVV